MATKSRQFMVSGLRTLLEWVLKGTLSARALEEFVHTFVHPSIHPSVCPEYWTQRLGTWMMVVCA